MRKDKAKMNNESEEPTQVVDLSSLSSQTSAYESKDVIKSDSNLSSFAYKPKAVEKKTSTLFAFSSKTKAASGDWMTKRSFSSQSSSSSIVNTRWSMGKTAKRKVIEDETERKAVEDELLLSAELVKQGMSPITTLKFSHVGNNKSTDNPYNSDDNIDDESASATIRFTPCIHYLMSKSLG